MEEMKNDIKALYKYLMFNQQASLSLDWRPRYDQIVGQVNELRKGLELGVALDDQLIKEYCEGYDSLQSFMNKGLFLNSSNGIASIGGQGAAFTDDKKLEARNSSEFIRWLEKIIKGASAQDYKGFYDFFHDFYGANRPNHVNRLFAACSTDLCSTVNGPKFDHVVNFMVTEGYLDSVEGSNWYERNSSLMAKLHQIFSEELSKGFIRDEDLGLTLKVDKVWLSIFVWLIYENIEVPINLQKSVVKYGAPGTGKTFGAKLQAKVEFDFWKQTFGKNSPITFDESCDFVQFHPAYSYEDFLEGIRPKLIDGESKLGLQNGIFKEHCIEAGKWEIDVFYWQQKGAVAKKKWNELTKADLDDVGEKADYWDFLSSIDGGKKLHEVIPPYFMVIDEINRAELSRVFGELMYCMEYRGIEGAIKTQYVEMNTEDTAMVKTDGGYKFFIPHNMFLLAAMNTIDRSVDSFDFALRRRFKWEEVSPNIPLLKEHLLERYPQWAVLADNLKSLNEEISKEVELLGKDYCIGHSYLWELNYPSDYSESKVRKAIWNDKIGSLLHEYLRGSGKEALLETFKNKFGISNNG